jgi:voltage-gated potassium channel
MADDRDRRSAEPEPSESERWGTLFELEEWLEKPMFVLSFVWLALFILEFTRGLPTTLETLGWAIWGIFVVDFALRFTIAPDKRAYLRRNAVTAISLVVPALRIFRIARAFRILQATRATRSFRLVKVVGTLNRGMRAIGRSFARRGFGYVLALTTLVIFAGAAAMFAFEHNVPDSPLTDYGTSLWWTAMMMTTVGSDYFPHTPEGRTLSLLLAVFAFSVWGYVTATLATFFVGRDAARPDGELPSQELIESLRAEVMALREEMRDRQAAGPRA